LCLFVVTPTLKKITNFYWSWKHPVFICCRFIIILCRSTAVS